MERPRYSKRALTNPLKCTSCYETVQLPSQWQLGIVLQKEFFAALYPTGPLVSQCLDKHFLVYVNSWWITFP